ncbi:MAG: RES family NAD+ phosphorylase [Methylococcales bacterium]
MPVEVFGGEVFRATRKNLDPLAFSTRAGRWARNGGAAVLYTSLEREGALAEIAFHWSQLTPLPTKPVMLHRLRVTTKNSLRLIRTQLPGLGVDPADFGRLDYANTQAIGEAVAFLGHDGLITPSARWDCDNLTLFNDNHAIENELAVLSSEAVDWIAWGKEEGIISLPDEMG